MKDGYKVKICGTTNRDDLELAAQFGADYAGAVIEVDFSPRSLTIEGAVELFDSPPIPLVALVFQMSETRLDYLIRSLQPFAVQFLSQEEPGIIGRLRRTYPAVQIWQSIHLPAAGSTVDLKKIKVQVHEYIDAGVDLLLYDTVAVIAGKQKFGGTGLVSDWATVRQLMDEIKAALPIFLAGGINPENVGQALKTINPDGVDLCSGVEACKGKKDPEKLKALMGTVRGMKREENAP